jgi:hypothetical protein
LKSGAFQIRSADHRSFGRQPGKAGPIIELTSSS